MFKIKLLIFLILSFILLGSVFYAWIIFDRQTPIGQIPIGQLSLQINKDGQELIDVSINQLMYVDFHKDVIHDETETLDLISSSIFIEIEIFSDTFSIRNIISFEFPEDQDDLIYLVILEGVNLDATHTNYTTYFDLIASLVNPLTATESEYRQAIQSYNQNVLSTIAQIVLNPFDKMVIQFVFWGDYNELTHPNTYLDINYIFALKIESVQSNREDD